jgi:hypothetical protein
LSSMIDLINRIQQKWVFWLQNHTLAAAQPCEAEVTPYARTFTGPPLSGLA